jgi:hypothetical protein
VAVVRLVKVSQFVVVGTTPRLAWRIKSKRLGDETDSKRKARNPDWDNHCCCGSCHYENRFAFHASHNHKFKLGDYLNWHFLT